MQYTLTISQTKALEWGLNAQQALLFSFVYECPSWAKPISNEDGVFFALSKAKIVEELPLLTDKPDTAYRLLKQLEAAGVVELSHTPSITLVRLTDKGKEWNKALDGSEKYAEKGRKNIRGTSEKYPTTLGKISDLGSEKYPTNQDTNNQDTNNHIDNCAVPASNDLVVSDALPEKTKKSPPRKTRLPDDFLLTPERAGKAYGHWQSKSRNDLSALDEFASFQNHHLQHGKTMACWESAWRTWYTNAVKFNRPPGQQQRFLSANEKLAKAAESITDYEKSLDF